MELEKFIQIASHIICFGLAVDLFYIFLRAYFNGNTIMININAYGEAKMEIVLISITLVFCLVGLVFAWINLKV